MVNAFDRHSKYWKILLISYGFEDLQEKFGGLRAMFSGSHYNMLLFCVRIVKVRYIDKVRNKDIENYADICCLRFI